MMVARVVPRPVEGESCGTGPAWTFPGVCVRICRIGAAEMEWQSEYLMASPTAVTANNVAFVKIRSVDSGSWCIRVSVEPWRTGQARLRAVAVASARLTGAWSARI